MAFDTRVSLTPAPTRQRQEEVILNSLLLDGSGSMYGPKHRAAVDELKEQLSSRKYIKPGDEVEVTTFHSKSVELLARIKVCRVDGTRDVTDKYSPTGRSTALYDAIKQKLADLRNSAPRHMKKVVICFTDGADNASSTSLKEACEIMSKPGVSNLNFYLIAIGISAQDKDAMRQLCRPQHAHLIECGDDYNIFRKTYSETFAKANSIRISGSGELGTMGAALLTQQLGEMMMAVMSNGRGLQRAQAPMLGLPHGGRGSGGAGRAGPGMGRHTAQRGRARASS